MMRPTVPTRALTLLLVMAAGAHAQVSIHPSALGSAPLRGPMRPAWHAAPSLHVLELAYDGALSETANGTRLRQAIQSLVPGDTLRVTAGVWSVDGFFDCNLRGTATAPIRIIGEAGTVLTRPNAGQNVINFGGAGAGPMGFLALRGFEVRGGSFGIRVRDAEELWIDACHVHHTGSVAIGANSHNTLGLTVTRCEIHDTGATGEALYLGGNNASAVAREAVIALNHIHHTGGSQGDGIELKQGSSGCLIAENVIHHTNYPGILCYGTGGGPLNVIEGNLVYATVANPFQVQGEAIVRNNLVFAQNGPALQSAPHQGQPTRLSVVHNTFIAASGRAATLRAWAHEPGMVLANNVLYSQSGDSLAINGGIAGITIEGNVVFGPTYQAGSVGFAAGNGLADFVDVSWDGSRRDARAASANGPLALAPLTFAAQVRTDLTGAMRTDQRDAGALERGSYGRYVGALVPSAPRLRLSRAVGAPGGPLQLRIEGLAPFGPVALSLSAPFEPPPLSGPWQASPVAPLGSVSTVAQLIRGRADAAGVMTLELPPVAQPNGALERIDIIALGTVGNGDLERSRRMTVTERH